MELSHLHIEAQNGELSTECVDRGIISFLSFIEWVEQLPYKRNSDRANFKLVFEEECGTCSTKNALIKGIADENGWSFVQLFLGIYKMDEQTNPGIGQILKGYDLPYLPEAHTYLKFNDVLHDYTGLSIGDIPFSDQLLNEIEIKPEQIGDFKLNLHKDFMKDWSKSVGFSFAEMWNLRESCILHLSK